MPVSFASQTRSSSDATHKLLLSLCFEVVKGVDVEKNEFAGETPLINLATFSASKSKVSGNLSLRHSFHHIISSLSCLRCSSPCLTVLSLARLPRPVSGEMLFQQSDKWHSWLFGCPTKRERGCVTHKKLKHHQSRCLSVGLDVLQLQRQHLRTYMYPQRYISSSCAPLSVISITRELAPLT